MIIYSKFNRTVFCGLLTNLTLLVLCSCSNPEDKILGKWNTSSNCTSKKGVNINYAGSSRFLKDGTAKDNGQMKIKSTDAEGKNIEIEVNIRAQNTWSIVNNKISQKNIQNEISVWFVRVNSNTVYSGLSNQNNPQSQALADRIVDDLKKSLKAHDANEFEITQLDDKKLIIKDKSVEHSENFDPGICETQEFVRGVYLGAEIEGP